MDTTDATKAPPSVAPPNEATPAKFDWRKWWERIATVLAIIGLIDVTGQVVKWAAAIHWFVSKYAVVKAYLFRYLPFHVPEQWRTSVILFAILLSVVNVGFYRQRRRLLIIAALGYVLASPMWILSVIIALFGPRAQRILHSDAIFAFGDKLDYANLSDTVATMAERIVDGIPFTRGNDWLRLGVFICILMLIGGLLGALTMVAVFKVLHASGSSFVLGLALGLAGVAVVAGIIIAWRWVLMTAGLFLIILAINQAYVWLS